MLCSPRLDLVAVPARPKKARGGREEGRPPTSPWEESMEMYSRLPGSTRVAERRPAARHAGWARATAPEMLVASEKTGRRCW